MSYFSHNPEAYDEIEVSGVMDMVLRTYPDTDEDELREYLEGVQWNEYERFRKLADAADRFIADRTNDFFSDMADSYLAGSEV